VDNTIRPDLPQRTTGIPDLRANARLRRVQVLDPLVECGLIGYTEGHGVITGERPLDTGYYYVRLGKDVEGYARDAMWVQGLSGQELFLRREAAGLSVSEQARGAAIASQDVSKYESGTTNRVLTGWPLSRSAWEPSARPGGPPGAE
jgi:hypothetical protein